MVRPGGHFAIALYAKTRLCGFWTAEKKFYSNAPRPVQLILSGTYTLAFCALEFRHRKNPIRYIRNYHQSRGMSFFHDVHDWLGGYPYESASPQEVRRFLHDSEFDLTREFVQRDAKGYLGSGCNEFVAIRKTA
jgi:2-polyprenyl-6-hydroxyphenyl methylase/3-demethylubiquinone-9 3-methyltransferase